MPGELSVLNCGKGDIRITLNPGDEIEAERAKRMINDMLRRGYILAIEVDGKLKKVDGFDDKTSEYIIVEGALYSGDSSGVAGCAGKEPPGEQIAEPAAPKQRGRPKGSTKKRVPMSSVKATAIPPTGGG